MVHNDISVLGHNRAQFTQRLTSLKPYLGARRLKRKQHFERILMTVRST